MKPSSWFRWGMAIFIAAEAVIQAQVPATVLAGSVNARSRPSVLRGEVVTRLDRGQQVTVFEEGLPGASPKDTVTEWTRIELPAGTPVWVSSDHVLVPAGTVKPRWLNVRAGPSEDFGVLGTVAEGTVLKVLAQQPGWLKVEAPLGLSAFVASQFLDVIEPGVPAMAPVLPPTASPIVSTQAMATLPVTPPETAARPAPAATTPETPVKIDSTPAPANDVPTAAEPPDTGVGTIEQGDPESPVNGYSPRVLPPGDVPEISHLPRIIRREGVVRGTLSIQAPTPFELVAADNNGRLDYLLPHSSNILIRPYRGQRVYVTGEEYLEPRWQNAPVMVVREIRLAP